MGFWDKLKGIFEKEEKEYIEEQKQTEIKQELTDVNEECWACGLSIHENQKARKLQGKRLHLLCFKKLKKIALSGKNPETFI